MFTALRFYKLNKVLSNCYYRTLNDTNSVSTYDNILYETKINEKLLKDILFYLVNNNYLNCISTNAIENKNYSNKKDFYELCETCYFEYTLYANARITNSFAARFLDAIYKFMFIILTIITTTISICAYINSSNNIQKPHINNITVKK